MEQLLLVTSCDSPAGIGASLRTHTGQRTTHGWTHRRDVGNSILDDQVLVKYCLPFLANSLPLYKKIH